MPPPPLRAHAAVSAVLVAMAVAVLATPPQPAPPQHVCLLTYALVGPIKTGGVATAMTALAEALAAEQARVTVLYMFGEDVQGEADIAHWRAHYAQKNVRLEPLPDDPEDAPLVPSAPSAYVARAFRALEWVLSRAAPACDVIHAHEWHGPAFFVAKAKAQGHPALQQTRLITTLHCPSLFFSEGSNQLLNSVDVFVGDFLEREQTRLSDLVVSPSAFMLRHVKDVFGWALPARTRVLQNILSPAVLAALVRRPARDAVRVREFVFFGRIEPLKGIKQFCDALDALGERRAGQPPSFDVTFLGNANMPEIDAAFYLKTRSHRWTHMLLRGAVSVLTDLLQPEAVDYMHAARGRVAVMPSLAENSPYVVLECISLGIPFIASDVGGVAELVRDGDGILFEPTVDGMLGALERALEHGVVRASPAANPLDIRRDWLELSLAPPPPPPPSPPPPPPVVPVTVCIVSHNRAELLLQAVRSVLAQRTARAVVSLVVVDSGSDDARTLERLTLLEQFFATKTVRGRVVRLGENELPARARNACVREAAAESAFVAFLDDDDVAAPHWLDTMLRVTHVTGADVVTSMVAFFEGEGAPHTATRGPGKRWVTLGAAADVGFTNNVFGAYAALWRTPTFRALGGFSGEKRALNEDWELFARAVLAGYRLESVPEALLWYRQGHGPHLLSKISETSADRMRALKPYFDRVPPQLRNVLQFAFGAIKDVENVDRMVRAGRVPRDEDEEED